MNIKFNINQKNSNPLVIMFEGAPLRMNEKKIGRITQVTCTENGMEVTAKVYKRFEKAVREKL